MANKSFDATGAQYVWDSTSLKLATTCLRKYQYKMVFGWQPFTKSPHLDFGSWYATALEHYHKARALGTAHEEALVTVIEEAFISTWLHDRDPEGARIPETGSPWVSTDPLKTRENLIRSIVWYLEEFEDDSMSTFILSDGSPAVEHTFRLPVEDGILFSGHIDRLVNYSGGIYVTDNKTTKATISPYFFRQFDLDIQMSMYTFAGKMIYNIPVKGVVIDAVQIAVGFSRYSRSFTVRSEDQLNEWYDETLAKITDVRKRTASGDFPRNLTSCSDYGGCEFREVCSVPREHRKQFLLGSFTPDQAWDPMDVR